MAASPLHATRRCRPTVDYVIAPHAWQAYGTYDDGSVFAGAVRASNAYMAADATRQVMLAPGTITSLSPIGPIPRSESDKRRVHPRQPVPRLMTAPLEYDDLPVHRPAAPDAPIPGRHWYSGCDPDRPRVGPDGVCLGCGDRACPDCGHEVYPDGVCGCPETNRFDLKRSCDRGGDRRARQRRVERNPAMTKKDFTLIASVLAETRNVEVTSRRLLSEAFADALEVANPRFDRDRFLAAALRYDGPSDEKGTP